jgi:hypothetical protein
MTHPNIGVVRLEQQETVHLRTIQLNETIGRQKKSKLKAT